MWARYDTLEQARDNGWLTLADAFREARERGIRMEYDVHYHIWPPSNLGLWIVSRHGRRKPIPFHTYIVAVRREVLETALANM